MQVETASGSPFFPKGSRIPKDKKYPPGSEVDNEKVSIAFDHMRVRTPILSVRKLVRDDREIYIKRCGSIRKTTSGKQIKFFERAGV